MNFSMDPNLLALLQQQESEAAGAPPVFDDPAAGLSPLGIEDPKTALNTFCQRATKRAITKTCIVYSSQQIGQVYQAVVRLNCMAGIEFAGEVGNTTKDAEKNSAKQALSHYAGEIATASVGKNSKKRKAPGPDPVVTPDGLVDLNPVDATVVINSRMRLNAGLMRIVHRALNKDDIVYNTVQTALGYQCTIALPSLPGDWGAFAWAGEVANKKKEAEEHAAKHALEALRADPGMAAALDTPPAKKPTTGKWHGGGKFGGGKFGGKGWGGGCGGCGGKGWFK